jgi:hypothetical protein
VAGSLLFSAATVLSVTELTLKFQLAEPEDAELVLILYAVRPHGNKSRRGIKTVLEERT